jgi:DNA-binding NtrC family response regulator
MGLALLPVGSVYFPADAAAAPAHDGWLDTMTRVWIVHRDARTRGALARLVGAGVEPTLGTPTDPRFESVPAPDLVLLGLAGDFEAELEFAHRHAPRLPGAAWLLVADPADEAEARRLFDALDAEVLVYPPRPAEVQQRLRAFLARRSADPLSERRVRDAVAAAFARYFGDLEIPELLRSLDPRLGGVPLLVRGEPGTGRGILARYVHAFGGTTGGAFATIACQGVRTRAELLAEVERAAAAEGARSALTLCLEEVDRLPILLQREVRDWLTIAPPAAAQRSLRLRVVALAGERGQAELEPSLADALSGLAVRIPPLRARAGSIPAFVADVARAWARGRGERARQLSREALDALAAMPWPGNHRELEGVVARTLAAGTADPVGLEDLRFEESSALAEPLPAAIELGAEPEAGELEVSGELEAQEIPVAGAAPRIEPAPAPREAAAPRETAREAAPPPREAVREPREPAPARPAAAPPARTEDALRRLVGALAHEVRNPLVTIRTFAELLPERFEDPEFRTRFAAVVGGDVARIERVVARLSRLARVGSPEKLAVDAAALVEELVEARRPEIQRRRLIMLTELDRSRSFVLADATQLRDALEAILDEALALVPDGGDLFVASKHHAGMLRGGPAVRVLVRFQDGSAAAGPVEGVSVAENSLDLVLAELLVRAQGGTFHLDSASGRETLLVIDLPAPA